MIIIRMSGGLGNQMFQYALYLKLVSLGREVCFDDTTEYTTVTDDGRVRERRPKMLGVFGINVPKVRQEDLIRMTDSDLRLSSRIRRKITGRKSKLLHDQDFHFDPEFLRVEDGYFAGCFQSPLYFAGVEEKVRRAFTFPENILDGQERAQAVRQQILEPSGEGTCRAPYAACDSASIHLRFGDYLDNQKLYGGICTDAYYDAAVRYLTERCSGIRFFVFSNDETRAREWISRRENPDAFRYASVADEDHGYIDLYLMCLCRHHIIANSSFSWWGAYVAHQASAVDASQYGAHQASAVDASQYVARQASAPDDSAITIAPALWVNTDDGSGLYKADIYTDDMVRIRPDGVVAKGEGAEQPLVSVIVAAYNVERYLPAALESVLAQTYKNLEILVVDDGSTDKTPGICDTYARKDSRIRVIHKENGGLSDARNAALPVASGEYIAYLDGDDRMQPCMIEAMVRACLLTDAPVAAVKYRAVREDGAKTPSDAACCGQPAGPEEAASDQAAQNTRKPENARWATAAPDLREAKILTQDEALDNWIRNGLHGNERKYIIYNSVWSKLFRKDVAEGVLFPKGENSEDIPYTTRTLLKTDKVVLIPQPYYLYLQGRSGSIMNQKTGERRLGDELRHWQEQIRLLTEAGKKKAAAGAKACLHLRYMQYDLEFRGSSRTAPYAGQIEQWMHGHRKEILEDARKADCVSRKERLRLQLFLFSPALYEKVLNFYGKAAAKRRGRTEFRNGRI